MDKWAYILASFLYQIESELEELQLPENNTPMEKSVGILFITNGKHFVFLCTLGSSSAKVILQNNLSPSCVQHCTGMQVTCNMNMGLFAFNRNCWQSSVRDNWTASIPQNKEAEEKQEEKEREKGALLAWRWLYLATFTFLYKNSSYVHVFNTDPLLTTNSKEKQKTRWLRKWEK